MRSNVLLACTAAALTIVGLSPQSAFAAGGPAVVEQGEAAQNARQRRGRSAPTRSPQELIAAAQPLLAQASVSCDVADAKSLGTAADGSEVFEVQCASGPGFLVASTTPPIVTNCLAIAAQPAPTDPEAASIKCSLPHNLDAVAILTPMAQSAGINCTIDAAAWVGRTAEGAERYEIGCSGTDGYWLSVPAAAGAATTVVDCLTVVQAGLTCASTTPEEQAATVAAKLVGVSAPPCTVTGGRFAGANANGKFYEAKCADDSGFMFRVDNAGAFQQSYPCANAQNIGGGCKLTDVSGLFAAASERRMTLLAGAGFTCDKTQERNVGVERNGQGRDVAELACTDHPLGMVVMTPAEGLGGNVEAIDCLSAAARGVTCTFTSPEVIMQSLSRQLAAGDAACEVTAFRVIGALATDAGDRVEVKCADGTGLIADVPFDRVSPGLAKGCDMATRDEERCTL